MYTYTRPDSIKEAGSSFTGYMMWLQLRVLIMVLSIDQNSSTKL